MRVNIENMGGVPGRLVLLGGALPGEWPQRFGTWGLERDGLEGWYDSVDSREGDLVAIPDSNGSYWPEALYSESRVITVRGFFSALGSDGSDVTVGTARDLVASFHKAPVRITVSDEIGDRYCIGYVAASIQVTRVSDVAFKFSMVVSCPDPIKYGPESTVEVSGGGVALEVDNSGRAAVSPIIRSAGPITSLRVENATGLFIWSGPASTLSVDLREGVPRDEEGQEVGTVIFGEAILLPPGKSEVSVVANQATTFSMRAGWL